MPSTFKEFFSLTEYKIKSPGVFLGIFIGLNVLTGANLAAELLIGLDGTSLPVNVVFFLISLATTVWYWKRPDTPYLTSLIVVYSYAILEGMFLARPVSYYSIHFWFGLLIIVAFIVQGMRAGLIWFVISLVTFFFNSTYTHQIAGTTYPITIKMSPYLISHIIYLTGILAASTLLYRLLGSAYARMKEKSEELSEIKEQVQNQKALLEKYQGTLLHITRHEAALTGNTQHIIRSVCKNAAISLKTSRVSVWLLEQNNDLVRKFLYTPDAESWDSVTLHRSAYPNYFEALERQPYILANNAYTHQATAEFANTYLTPLSIHSMLDCPILLNQKPIGVICCEHQHEKRTWLVEDALFVQSLADFLATGYQNERILNLMKQVRQQNFELVEKNNSIAALNEEQASLNEELTSLNDQLSIVNESLEEAVKRRTAELEQQNKQLTEYAFINSHLLRAPLARLMGLAQLTTLEVTTVKEKELLHALEASAGELDQIIRKISDLLYKGNDISRDDVKEIIQRNFNDLK